VLSAVLRLRRVTFEADRCASMPPNGSGARELPPFLRFGRRGGRKREAQLLGGTSHFSTSGSVRFDEENSPDPPRQRGLAKELTKARILSPGRRKPGRERCAPAPEMTEAAAGELRSHGGDVRHRRPGARRLDPSGALASQASTRSGRTRGDWRGPFLREATFGPPDPASSDRRGFLRSDARLRERSFPYGFRSKPRGLFGSHSRLSLTERRRTS